jgi:hypothetical protein
MSFKEGSEGVTNGAECDLVKKDLKKSDISLYCWLR